MSRSAPTPQLLRVRARALIDGDGTRHAPGAVLVGADCTEHGSPPRDARSPAWRLLAAGEPSVVARHPAAGGAATLDLPNSILIPGLVNAHCHLDLTHIGPRPFEPDGGFVGWADHIRRNRPMASSDIGAAIARGVDLSLQGGVVAVGDIAGAAGGRPSLEPWRALRESPLEGVSFLEFFAIGMGRDRGQEAARRAMTQAECERAGRGIRFGLQPHAPNTVDRRVYEWAADEARRSGLAISTHLAETVEEREFVARAAGPQREFLERLGLWDESATECIGRGEHPVRHLASALAAARFLVAHVNDAPDETIEILARTGAAVAYCPRASAYFGAEQRLGPHRYRDMLAAGIVVALGTDSIVNLPAAAADVGVSTWDEMRVLARRDGTDPALLLRMATILGAAALGLDSAAYRFAAPSPLAGLVAVEAGPPTAPREDAADVLGQALRGNARPRLLLPDGGRSAG
ncbi:MAG: amidohydrolase family protein [Phycisphaerae bacterium]|nr:amidohydrolase family protein [Phycisphaerae bacterium]